MLHPNEAEVVAREYDDYGQEWYEALDEIDAMRRVDYDHAERMADALRTQVTRQMHALGRTRDAQADIQDELYRRAS